jgi:CRP-like cAMP-binding protein
VDIIQADRTTPMARNAIIERLPPASRERLMGVAETVALEANQVVYAEGKALTHVLFPCNGLLSIFMRGNGKSVEVAMLGDEGLFGLPLFFGAGRSPMRVVVQVESRAIRIKASDFTTLLGEDPFLAATLGRYAQAFSTMLGQGAVCFSAHMVEQRCARWLLMAHDRLRKDEFSLTQECLSKSLGVRRPTVSQVAEQMQHDGLIRYRQGRMTVLNRAGLEELACICYGVIAREFNRMLPPSAVAAHKRG